MKKVTLMQSTYNSTKNSYPKLAPWKIPTRSDTFLVAGGVHASLLFTMGRKCRVYLPFTFTAIRLTPGTLTKVSTGGSVNRQPRRGRRMIRKSSHPNLRSMPLWKLLVDGQAIIHLEARCEARNLTSSVLWVELRLLDSRFALKSCNYLFWGHSSLFLFLVSTRQSLWSIAWTHRSYGVVELLEGALKLFLPTGCIFKRAIFSKRQNSVDGFKIQKN